MARFKDFGSPDADVEHEAISFKVYGEEFFCHPVIPGKILLRFVKMSNSDDAGQTAQAIDEFFKHALVAESYERFEALTNDPERLVTVETLAAIIQWIVEEQSNRPTQGSEPSSTGA